MLDRKSTVLKLYAHEVILSDAWRVKGRCLSRENFFAVIVVNKIYWDCCGYKYSEFKTFINQNRSLLFK